MNSESREPGGTDDRHRFQRIDTAYREWTRNRADADKLRQLHTAISEFLAEADRGAVRATPPA